MISERIIDLIHGYDPYIGFIPTCGVDLQGWNSTDPIFAELVKERQPKVIVDVGVWKGASTLHLAKLLKDEGIDGCVIGVDTFLGSPEHWDSTREKSRVGSWLHGRPVLYEQFLANVVCSGLKDYVVPFAQTSVNAADMLKRREIQVDLVHIDAAHDYDSVIRDAWTYWRLLSSGGILIGDDYTSAWPDVMLGSQQFSEEVGCELVVSCPKWVVRKP